MSEERRPVPPGWTACNAPRPPPSTSSPALFAFGVTLVAWGLVTSLVLIVIGVALLGYALVHWIGEIRHDTT
jgi:hypothetical protein